MSSGQTGTRATTRFRIFAIYVPAHCAMMNAIKKARMGTSPVASIELPMFKPRVTAKSAQAMGNYALQITFSDGHATGIYSFEHLREICPCEACGRDFRDAQPSQPEAGTAPARTKV